MSESDRGAIDMAAARGRAVVDVSALRNLLHGGAKNWDMHRRMVEILSQDRIFDKLPKLYMNRSARYKNGLRMVHRLHELMDQHHWSYADLSKASSLIDETTPLTLQFIAFEPVIRAQASQEFLAQYGDLIFNHGVYGCYLQTELAHGSNVAGLETTATYIPQTREFEIHSPALTSSKWWIGAAGKTATHGVVQAQLMLPGGRQMGPHLFLVQLRSLEDHSLLPGVITGDIGPKAMGGNISNDNGFVRFDHVRIPAINMLSRFAQVTPMGRYIQPPHAKIGYGGMLHIRASMIMGSGWTIAKASTIAIRYATVRRQGNRGPDSHEWQIITYPSVYNRLLPILSRAYTFLLLGRNLEKSFADMMQRLAQGDTSLLAEMHATTSGLKVLVTTICVQDVETARRALGGHGYSAYAGLGRIYADQVASTTYEGDNFLLDLQVVRATLKAYRRVMSLVQNASNPLESTFLSPTTAYLRLLIPAETPSLTDISWQDTRLCVLLLERRALALVSDRAYHEHDADASADQRVSRAVTEAFVAEQVETFMNNVGGDLADTEGALVRDLLNLYLLTTLEGALVDLLSFGLLPHSSDSGSSSVHQPDASRGLRMEINQLCLKLLPQAIGLTDAFGFSDWELDSVLGVYDGKVYEALWRRVQTEPLNRAEVPDGYKEFIRPVLLRGQRLAAGIGAKAKM